MPIPSEKNEKKIVALSSVVAAVFLTAFKLYIGIETNSLGILSEAAHSGLDLLAAIITLVAVSVADKPADEEHQYGHGKIENISAFVETLLLVLTCTWIIWEAVDRLITHSHHVEANVWSYIVMGTAIVIDYSRSRALYRVARKYNSQALEADALHFSSDIWSSLTVLGGLAFVSFGYPIFDSVAAIVVAFIVLFVSYQLGRRTIDALMDRVPHAEKMKIEEAIRSVKGIEKLRSIRLRASGPKIFVDTTVAIRRTLPFERAHAIMDNIELAVRDAEPNADVIIHGEPAETQDETIIEKIRMIVVNKGLRPPHNLEVYLTDGKYYIDFDVEYEKGHSFAEAHSITSDIEQEIQQQLKPVGKVTIHMEEYHPAERELSNVTASELKLSKEIQAVVEKHKGVLTCKDLTLLQEGPQYTATLTCHLEHSKTLGEVHSIISEIEGILFKRFKQLRRITIHAEPE
ncbi:MAG: cation diffusion facilitator family transporter [bacterium]